MTAETQTPAGSHRRPTTRGRCAHRKAAARSDRSSPPCRNGAAVPRCARQARCRCPRARSSRDQPGDDRRLRIIAPIRRQRPKPILRLVGIEIGRARGDPEKPHHRNGENNENRDAEAALRRRRWFFEPDDRQPWARRLVGITRRGNRCGDLERPSCAGCEQQGA